MPSPRTDSETPLSEADLRTAALERLKKGSNPFVNRVTAIGTAEETILAGVPEFTANQLSELLDIIGLYRTSKPTTRVYPLLGERGSGKTHLLYSLRNELRQRAAESGEESLVIVVERLSPDMDAIDYLLWQIVNHLLAQRGEGGRMLGVIAGRLTARLLAEALRALPPHQRADLIPAGGFWSKLRSGAGKAQARLDAIDELIQRCDSPHPNPGMLRDACDKARVKASVAVTLVEQHLERRESKDIVGWFRRELYGRLARIALLDDRVPFEELHMGDFDDAPENIKKAGNLGRRLLDTWLELLAVLNIPVVVIFDQLEDYLRHPNPEQEKRNRLFFTDATARFINELRSVCVLVFAEKWLWNDMLRETDPFARDRLVQEFSLPGRPAKREINMPLKVESEIVLHLIRQRLRFQSPELDFTGLTPSFPFDGVDLKNFQKETTLREYLLRMAKRFDEIVHKSAPKKKDDDPEVVELPLPNLKVRLAELWRENVATAAKQVGMEMYFSTAFIPEVQNALDGWLQCLLQHGLTGAGTWHKVELVTDTKKQQYGYLNVIRTNGPNAPGIGIAAWFGELRVKPYDLRQRIRFFNSNPCPIGTLVMLRAQPEASLKGEALAEYEKAINAGRDVRIHQYEPKHLHSLMAFTPWQQAAVAELQTARETDPNADKVFRDYLAELSKEILGWVDSWRKPDVTATASATSVKGAKA